MLLSGVGVAKSMIHHCFRTKEQLFEAVLEEANRLRLEAINAAITPDSSPREGLLSFVEGLMHAFPSTRHRRRLFSETCPEERCRKHTRSLQLLPRCSQQHRPYGTPHHRCVRYALPTEECAGSARSGGPRHRKTMNIHNAIFRRGPLPSGWLVCDASPRIFAVRVPSAARTLSAVRPCAVLLGALMFGHTLSAQTAQTAPLQLTLKDSIALALKQNIDVQLANINLATSQQNRKLSRSALLRRATLKATEDVERYNLQPLIGLQIAGVPKNIGPFQSINIGSRFSTPVFDLSLLREYQASGHRLEASKEGEKSTRKETVLLTTAQYLGFLRAEASVKAAESRVQLAESLAKQAQDLLSSGVATNIDVSRAEVRVLTERQALIDAQSEIESNTFALRRILNVRASQRLEFLGSDTFSQTPLLDLPDPVSTALSQRPELLALSQRQEAAKYDKKAAMAESLPKLVFAGGWNEQGRSPQHLFPGYDYQVGFNVPHRQ
jgi:outer membrane protein TolC